MSYEYQEKPNQELEYETRAMVTSPSQITILLGHDRHREEKGITPESVFTFPISFPVSMITSYKTIEEFYADLASQWMEHGVQQRQAAALMGGAEQWERLRNDPAVTVRLSVAWAAAKPIQLKMINDPEPTVREYLARYGDDDIRHLLLDNELQNSSPNEGVLIGIATHTETVPMEEYAVKTLWDRPDLLEVMLRNMNSHKETLAMISAHGEESLRVLSAMKASEKGYSEIIHAVLGGNLSQMNRAIIEDLLEEAVSVDNDSTAFHQGTADLSEDLSHTPTFTQPIVTIITSESKELSNGQVLTLSDADAIFQKLDSQVMTSFQSPENKDAAIQRVSFRIEFSYNGALQIYEGQQDLGDGDGSLLDHIRSYQEYCSASEEWKNHVIRTAGTSAWTTEATEHKLVLKEFLPIWEQYRGQQVPVAAPVEDEISNFAGSMYELAISAIPEYLPPGQSREQSIAGLVQHIKRGDREATSFPLEKILRVGTTEQQEEATRLLKTYQARSDLWSANTLPMTGLDKAVQNPITL